MKKPLNIKTLARGMRVEDKAKLLFADRNKRAETSGKEGLLTPEEEKALIEDAQDLHQIRELNRLNRLYNVACMMFLDMQTACLNFRLAEGVLTRILVGMILVGEADDALGQAVYEIASKGYSEKQLDEKEIQEKVDKMASELRSRYKRGGLSNIFDYFEPSLREDSYFSIKKQIESQPNKLLQKAFMRTLRDAKAYKKQVYQWQYIESKAGIDLLGDREKKIINRYTKDVDGFIKLDGHLRLIKMYAEFTDKGLLKIKKLEEPRFISAAKDLKSASRLTKKEKAKAESEIEDVIHKKND
jgi:hypothetical protein